MADLRYGTTIGGYLIPARNGQVQLGLNAEKINDRVIDDAKTDTTAIWTASKIISYVTGGGYSVGTGTTLSSPKIDKILDANGNEEIIFVTTASAVNELTIANAATGGRPKISASGGDTNIDLELAGKGTGKINMTSDVNIATGKFIITPNGAIGIKLGDDAAIGDSNVAHMISIQSQTDATQGGIVFGSGNDTNLYRNGANALKTDDNFFAASFNYLSLTANTTGFSISGGTTTKALNVNNTLTLAGTDGKTLTINKNIALDGVDGKTLTLNNSVTLTATDDTRTLNIGNGGTLGSAAFTDSTNYTARGVSNENYSVKTGDVRSVKPSDISTANGRVRFRFGTLNENSTPPYVDAIDFSTYADSSGGNVNMLALRKDTQRIVHKYAAYNAANASDWVAKELAYLEDGYTKAESFQIDSDATTPGPKLKAVSGHLELRNSADSDWANLTVNNLVVKGTTFTVNAEEVTIDDNVLVLNKNATDATKTDGGIQVYRGTPGPSASLLWSETDQKWKAGLEGSETFISLEGHTHGTDVGAGGGTITGILPIANGGTGTNTTTAWGIVYGASGATAYGTTAAGASGQVLVSKGNQAPVWATLDMTYLPDSAFKKSVKAASTANLTVTATTTTLTNAGTKAALTLDGVTLAVGDRVLIKDQTTSAQNGIYTVTTVGTASVNWVLTRAASADSSSEIAGGMVNIDQGTQGGFMWSNNFKTTDTLGTTAMPWYRVYSTFDAATAATANKLALRDGSGNITAADFKVGTESVWRAGNHPAPINERYAIPIGGVTKWTAITIPNSKTYVVGGKQLVVYRDGIKQSLDSSSTAKDNDYWEVSTTQIRFNYSIPTGSVIEFRIIPL